MSTGAEVAIAFVTGAVALLVHVWLKHLEMERRHRAVDRLLRDRHRARNCPGCAVCGREVDLPTDEMLSGPPDAGEPPSGPPTTF